MRSTLMKAAVLVVGAATFATLAGTAQADPAAGVVPATTDLVGVGSDTTQGVLNTLTDHYNTKSPAPADKAYSWDATGSATITPKSGAATITRPNGSSAGISALIADGTTHNIDFARSSRTPKTDGSEVNYGFIEFARDTVTYATATTSNVPTTLTTLDLNTLYGSAAGSAACNRNAYLPQAGSGTRSFFLSSIGLTAAGTCAKDTFGGAPVQEHSATPLLNDPNAIAPFSVGRAVGVSGIQVNSVDDSVRPATKPNPSETARVNPADGQAVTTGGVLAYDRPLFNVVRKADKTVSKFSSLFGSLGYICSNATAKADIVAAGFRRSSNCGVDRN
jgi:ABC-type phosphate transport system substrate-binding protein